MLLRSIRFLLAIALTAVWLNSASALAQGTAETQTPTNKLKKEPPAEKDEDIETDDGLVLKTTFYPGTNGKETVPILMLHGWKGSRTDYSRLAKQLQADHGHAVLAPDMRGHGESVRMKGDTKSPPLTPERLKPDDLRRMAMDDLESMRRYLKRKNNDGELNLDKLCVIGAETGALFAMNWTAYDWSAPSLARVKQAQFVKGLVLLSPEWSFRKMQVTESLKTLGAADKLSVFVIYGRKHAPSVKTGQRIYNDLLKSRPAEEKETDFSKKTLFQDEPETTLQGAQMLGQDLAIEEQIAKFIELQVAAKDCKWQSYESITK